MPYPEKMVKGGGHRLRENGCAASRRSAGRNRVDFFGRVLPVRNQRSKKKNRRRPEKSQGRDRETKRQFHPLTRGGGGP